MGVPFPFLLLAAAFPIVPALGAQSPPNQVAKPPFSISISLAQEVVKAGSEVRLDIVLTNILDQDIVIARCGEPNYQIEVYDSQGKPLPKLNDCVPKEDPGHPGWTSLCPGDVTTASAPICRPQNQILKPHEVLKEATVISKLCDLSRAGKYTIQVQLANDPRTIIEVPRKFHYGSPGPGTRRQNERCQPRNSEIEQGHTAVEPAPQP
jgi:hypothetical protein